MKYDKEANNIKKKLPVNVCVNISIYWGTGY